MQSEGFPDSCSERQEHDSDSLDSCSEQEHDSTTASGVYFRTLFEPESESQCSREEVELEVCPQLCDTVYLYVCS